MKKTVYFTAFLLLISVIGISQEHLSFKGIPIEGNISKFANKLGSKGFKLIDTKGNMATLKGSFINRDCDIYVVSSKKSNTVWKTVIYFSENISWSSLKSDYNSIKKQYQKKYGEGKSYEYFKDPYYEGDSYELQALKKEKCVYVTFFETEKGAITVEATSFGSVSISYQDNLSSEINKKEKQEIIDDDI